MNNNFDVIIIGAGSVGVPCAMYLAEKKLKVLVIDSFPSAGQGQNKSAIGGIRATHSDGAKIRTALESIKIFSGWQKKHGDDINWKKGGYLFPVYTKNDKRTLEGLLKKQKSFGLNIDWVNALKTSHIVKGINTENLLGGIYSPDDGSASPLLALNAFYKKAVEFGAEFKFNETVTNIKTAGNKVTGVKTNKAGYKCSFVINAAGAYGEKIGKMVGMKLPVTPDRHEGAVTEPVQKMFEPMIVDVRAEKNSKNYYFYQNSEGQIIFCMTPLPLAKGTDVSSTSSFLPTVSKRMVSLIPKLSQIKVRRTWAGLYPMTPDGLPIVGVSDKVKGFISAVGMCGQGFMLGPGLGKLMTRLITNELNASDKETLKGFSSYRKFADTEIYK